MPGMPKSFDSVSSRDLKHLPLIAEAFKRLGIAKVIGEELPDDARAFATHGMCVLVMVLNILCGRVALYKMNEWLDGFDYEVLIGEGIDPKWFTDDRLAATLDRIFYPPWPPRVVQGFSSPADGRW